MIADVQALRAEIEAMLDRSPRGDEREAGARFHLELLAVIDRRLAPMLAAAKVGHEPPTGELTALREALAERVRALPYRGTIHLQNPTLLWGTFAARIADLRLEHALASTKSACACEVQARMHHAPPRTDRLKLLSEVRDEYESLEIYACGHCGHRWVHTDISTEQYTAWAWSHFGPL